MEHIFRIVDFNVYNEKDSSYDESSSSNSDEENNYISKKDLTRFVIQIFGVNEKGETCSIIAEDYKPFFYVLVNDSWTIQTKDNFLTHIKDKIGKRGLQEGFKQWFEVTQGSRRVPKGEELFEYMNKKFDQCKTTGWHFVKFVEPEEEEEDVITDIQK